MKYWEEADLVANALRDEGHEYWAQRLKQAGAGAVMGGELAGAYFALLVEILDLPAVSGEARSKAQQFFSRLSNDLYYGNESHAAESVDYVRARIKQRRGQPDPNLRQ